MEIKGSLIDEVNDLHRELTAIQTRSLTYRERQELKKRVQKLHRRISRGEDELNEQWKWAEIKKIFFGKVL